MSGAVSRPAPPRQRPRGRVGPSLASQGSVRGRNVITVRMTSDIPIRRSSGRAQAGNEQGAGGPQAGRRQAAGRPQAGSEQGAGRPQA
eukprot:11169936-Lingulodinium_polyedra.AAC.1